MKKRYLLELDYTDISITLEIDTEVLTSAMATELNEFWLMAEEVLNASDGDEFQAVARRAASSLLPILINGYHPRRALQELVQEEGWAELDCGDGCPLGLSIIDHDVPTFDSSDLIVTDQTEVSYDPT